MPLRAQLSAVQGIVVKDLNEDGHQDLVIAGNWYPAEVETGRADAGAGLALLGNGRGEFTITDSIRHGLYVGGDVRDLQWVQSKDSSFLVVAKNDDRVQVVRVLAGKKELK